MSKINGDFFNSIISPSNTSYTNSNNRSSHNEFLEIESPDYTFLGMRGRK